MMSVSHVAFAFWLAVAGPDAAALEKQAKAIEAMLIAPCCWSQQVSLHQSPASDEIKQTVRRLLADGQTQQQILDRYVAEYGDRILAEPPARGFSAALYVAPWVFLAGSIGLVVVIVRRLRAPGTTAPPDVLPAAANDDESDRIDEDLRNLD
jgi:cytochrome c-type biogenesis protein CcmH